MSDSEARPRRESVIRAVMPGVELRAADAAEGSRPTLHGHFSRFNEWTEINSAWEGRFMERFAPGAFKKTISESRDRMKVLFQHGQDPQVGDKPIAAITDLREDGEGAYYEAALFDGLPPLVTDGLRANQYGASFRFSVMRESENKNPPRSDYNPLGLPERTVKEARVAEFGPVTFPAYDNATAGVRSLTDEFLMRCFEQDPAKLRTMFERATEPAHDRKVAILEEAGDSLRMDSEDVGTLAEMLACASTYIEEQDEEDPAELAAITAMQAIQADLIKLLNVEAVEDEPDEPEDERSGRRQQDAPSEDDAGADEPHLADERREDKPPHKARPIYGTRRKETSKPWLLGPSKSMKRS